MFTSESCGIDDFERKLITCFDSFRNKLSTDADDWVIKGFIDVYKNVYTISVDTKVISKIIELMLFPVISKFAEKQSYKIVLSEYQNHYPDITFILPDSSKIALDLKSTYRIDSKTVNGFTLGAFTGYFRQRDSDKNITFPYEQYSAHFVLGVIYSRNTQSFNDHYIYTIDDLCDITSVIKDFDFLLHEKWKIASDTTGSGNTKNIGSIKDIESLLKGKGVFEPYGQNIFDDYWMNYLTDDMARKIDSKVPYRNIKEYWKWKNR